MSIHGVASEGFDRAAEVYAKARPGYPDAAVDFVAGLLGGGRVLDLAAGTGKFTEALVERGVECVAVEPVEGMRRAFAQALPGVEILEGTAESIPLADQSVNGVTVAQAFHWFRPAEAAREIHRVLRPGGRLALIWNVRDESHDWVHQITEIIAPYEGEGEVRVPRHREQGWKPGFFATGLFTELDYEEFAYAQPMDVEGLVARVESTSFISVLGPDDKARVHEAVRALCDSHPDLAGRAEFVFPYVTEVTILARAE